MHIINILFITIMIIHIMVMISIHHHHLSVVHITCIITDMNKLTHLHANIKRLRESLIIINTKVRDSVSIDADLTLFPELTQFQELNQDNGTSHKESERSMYLRTLCSWSL